jgi:hypothetical protein
MLDLGAAEADVAQEAVIELAEMTALAGTVEPVHDLVEKTRNSADAGLAA